MVSCAPNDQTPTAEEARLLAGYSTKSRPVLLAGLRDPDPVFRALVWKMMELRPEERLAVIRALEEELEKRPKMNTSDHDICSTLHFELDFETYVPSPERDRSWAPGTVRHSDASYSLVLNRNNGRWTVQLVWWSPVGDDDDQDPHVIFGADDQPDLSALAEAFQMLADREVLNATPR